MVEGRQTVMHIGLIGMQVCRVGFLVSRLVCIHREIMTG